MGNYVHLLIEELNEDLAKIMKRMGASYVYWYNLKYKRTGNLFQGRYKSEVVEEEDYLLEVLRYIHQNPIKVGITSDEHSYKWSSYNDYILGTGITDTDYVLNLFGDAGDETNKAYEEYHGENYSNE